MTTSMHDEWRMKHGRTITTSHSFINRMTHRLCTPDAGKQPVHQTSEISSGKRPQTNIPNIRSKSSASINNTKVELQESKLPLYMHRISILTNSIQVYGGDRNIVIEEFNNYGLQTVNKYIPKGSRKKLQSLLE